MHLGYSFDVFIFHTGNGNGVVPYPIYDDNIDDSEFLHRYEDICNLEREQRFVILILFLLKLSKSWTIECA